MIESIRNAAWQTYKLVWCLKKLVYYFNLWLFSLLYASCAIFSSLLIFFAINQAKVQATLKWIPSQCLISIIFLRNRRVCIVYSKQNNLLFFYICNKDWAAVLLLYYRNDLLLSLKQDSKAAVWHLYQAIKADYSNDQATLNTFLSSLCHDFIDQLKTNACPF